MAKEFMKIGEALQAVLDLAEDNADNSIIDRHASEAEREEVAKNRRTALDTVQDFLTNVVLEGRHEATPPKILIWMEGGLIQDIGATVEIDVVSITEETEGGDPENIRTLKLFGDENKKTDFYINDWGKVEAAPEWVDHYINQITKEEPEEPGTCALEEAEPK